MAGSPCFTRRIVLFGAAMIVSALVDAISAGEQLVAMPYLISRQPDSVQEAWQTVEQLVRENELLESPLPDPYFARGDLWSAAGSHEDALEDYLRATKLVAAGRPNLVEQSRALARLSEALDRLSRRPQPNYPAEAEQAFRAGIVQFEQRRTDLADLYFAEATRLRPSDAVYRTYRAVAYRRNGKTADANRQMAVAVSILRRAEYNGYPQTREFHIRLERVQGTDRNWVNEFIRSPTSERFLSETEAAQYRKLKIHSGR